MDAYYDEPNFRSNPASRFFKSTDLTPSILIADARAVRPYKQGDNITPFGRVNGQQTTDNRLQITSKNKKNYENDIEKIVRDIERRSLDITDDYHKSLQWTRFACSDAQTERPYIFGGHLCV